MQLVTIEDLDWKAVSAATERGDLPQFGAILSESIVFLVRPEAPADSCSNWASIATGVSTKDHGVTFPLEAWAGGLRRTTRASWRRPPVWQMLADRGFATASIAFPFAGPGAAWSGAHVDERILEIGGLAWEDWPLPLNVAPELLREDLRPIRVHSADVHPKLLEPFERERANEPPARRQVLAAALAQSSTMFAAAEVVAHLRQPDFMALHVNWPRMFTSALGSSKLPSAFWELLDGGLSGIRGLAGPDSTSIFVSSGSGGGPAFVAVHRPAGKPGSGGWASYRDVVPTILSQFGLRDPDLVGRPLLRIDEPLSAIVTEWSISPDYISSEDCDRVEAFGHVLPGPPLGWPAPKLIAEAELLLEEDSTLAAHKVRMALEASPRSPSVLAVAGLLAFAQGEIEELEGYADMLADVDPHSLRATMLRAGVHVLRKEPRQAAPLLRRIECEGNRDDRLRVAAAWLMLRRGSEAERVLEAIVAEDPNCVPALLALASRKRTRLFDAEQLLRRVLTIQPDHRPARAALVDVLTASGRTAEAHSVAESRSHSRDQSGSDSLR